MTQTQQATVKVGSFFVASWGYDQTNVYWYQVKEITKSGKSVKVQRTNSDGSRLWGSHNHPVLLKRLNLGGYKGAMISFDCFNAYLHHEGETYYETPAGFGH